MKILFHSARAAFSLIELLVVMAIFGILAVLAVSAFNSIGKAGRLTKAGADVSSLLEQARTHAMANNAPVWVGFYPETNALAIAVVTSRDGSISVTGTNLVELGRVRYFEGIKLDQAPLGTNRPGVDAGGQLASSTNSNLQFSTTSGGQTREFKNFLRFNSRGEAQLNPSTRNRVIEIGLRPQTGNTNNYVAIQVGGLTGSVKLYRP